MLGNTCTLLVLAVSGCLARQNEEFNLQFSQTRDVGNDWIDVTTEQIYEPIVMATTPVLAGDAVCVPQIKDVTKGMFKIRCTFLAAQDNDLKVDAISWLVASAGVHKLQNGIQLQAGAVTLNRTNELLNLWQDKYAGQWKTVNFYQQIAKDSFRENKKHGHTAVVLSQLQTMTNEENVYLHSRQRMVTERGFGVALQYTKESDSQLPSKSEEMVGWIAMEHGDTRFTKPDNTTVWMVAEKEDVVLNEGILGSTFDFIHSLSQADESMNVDVDGPLVYTGLQTYPDHDPQEIKVDTKDHHEVDMRLVEISTNNTRSRRQADTGESAAIMNEVTAAAGATKPNNVGVVMISDELKANTDYTPATAACPDFTDKHAPAHSSTECRWHGGDSVCEVTCDYGYYMDGARMSVCSRITGEWSDVQRECREIPVVELQSFQVGLAEEVGDGWTKIETDDIMHPVVFSGIPTYVDTRPCLIQVRKIRVGSFEIRCQKPDTVDFHREVKESVAWMVVRMGAQMLSDGVRLVAGTKDLFGAHEVSPHAVESPWLPFKFDRACEQQPVVFTQIQTYDYADASILHSRVANVTKQGFTAVLESSYPTQPILAYPNFETVAWMSICNTKADANTHIHSLTDEHVEWHVHTIDVNGTTGGDLAHPLGEEAGNTETSQLIFGQLQDMPHIGTAALRWGVGEKVGVGSDNTQGQNTDNIHIHVDDLGLSMVGVGSAFATDVYQTAVVVFSAPVVADGRAKTCPVLEEKDRPKGLSTECTDFTYHSGSSCYHLCENQGVLRGPETRLCDYNGKWDQPLPSCDFSCGQVADIDHALVKCPGETEANINTQCTVECVSDLYELIGEDFVKCTENGWSKAPVCRPYERATMQFGQAEDITGQWKTVVTETISDPIVIAMPPSTNDKEPCIAEIKDVIPGSFQLRCKEPSNQDQSRRPGESIGWMVVERGIHVTPGGQVVEAGTADVRPEMMDHETRTCLIGPVGLQSSDLRGKHAEANVVFGQLQTLATGYDEFIGISVLRQGTDGVLMFALRHDEATHLVEAKHAHETLGYVAVTVGSGQQTPDKHSMLVLRANVYVDRTARTFPFSNTYATEPIMIAQLQDEDVKEDFGWLRILNMTRTSAQIFVEEDTTLDAEQLSSKSSVGALIVDAPFTLKTDVGGCPHKTLSPGGYKTNCHTPPAHGEVYLPETICTLTCDEGIEITRTCQRRYSLWIGDDCEGLKSKNELEKTHHEPTPHTNTGNIVTEDTETSTTSDTTTDADTNANTDSEGSGSEKSGVWEWVELGLILALSVISVLVALGFTVIVCKRMRNRRALKGDGEDWQSLSSDADFELRNRSDAVLGDLGDDEDDEPLNLGQDDEGNWVGEDGDHKLLQG